MMRSMRNGEITPEFIQCMKEDKAQADALAAELKIDRHCRGVVTGSIRVLLRVRWVFSRAAQRGGLDAPRGGGI